MQGAGIGMLLVNMDQDTRSSNLLTLTGDQGDQLVWICNCHCAEYSLFKNIGVNVV